MTDLTGVCVPICTPFKDSGASLDLKSFEANIDSLIENGVHIIAVNGGTGEFPFLAEDEKRKLAEVAVKRANGRAKVIAQTSAIRTEDAVENSKHADGIGADALLILPPYFEGPGEAGVRWHYEQLAKAVKTPIMAYNIPVYTQFDITPEIYARFSEIDGIKYIKDSTADPSRIEKLAGQGAKVFCGCDFLNFFAIVNGAAGLFTGSGNVAPALIRKLWDLSKSTEYGEAEKVWAKLRPISRLLWTLPFNPVAKAGSAMTGRPAGLCRMPVPPLSAEEMKHVEDAVAALSA
ncbi:dihydrodipicolinate synthase family protein [Tabrizicola oligotrophica]|uniref:Dihydrodipicolinate synthase family protein n=1 Tax=Tabrizicola oligotrophica TaxID=2710650 RepID=A0A6M0QSD7_9RHOB|nr:dihydrodipicolinate synthase family protein [Tabrizicola oligotrophica]NEY90347.1 dihydrodipicolinate synthase family protein [Tabrizicola oligotrophica]